MNVLRTLIIWIYANFIVYFPKKQSAIPVLNRLLQKDGWHRKLQLIVLLISVFLSHFVHHDYRSVKTSYNKCSWRSYLQQFDYDQIQTPAIANLSFNFFVGMCCCPQCRCGFCTCPKKMMVSLLVLSYCNIYWVVTIKEYFRKLISK